MNRNTIMWITIVGVASLGTIEIYDMFSKDRTEIVQGFEHRVTDIERTLKDFRHVLCKDKAHSFCGE